MEEHGTVDEAFPEQVDMPHLAPFKKQDSILSLFKDNADILLLHNIKLHFN
jgi:hypothetical protein